MEENKKWWREGTKRCETRNEENDDRNEFIRSIIGYDDKEIKAKMFYMRATLYADGRFCDSLMRLSTVNHSRNNIQYKKEKLNSYMQITFAVTDERQRENAIQFTEWT